MKFVKNAFTLAEVLVVLAILGVVAAITMPSLQTDTKKATVGPSLAKAISTLENANELLLADTGARSIQNVAGENYLRTLVREGYLKLVSQTIGTQQYSLFPSENNPEAGVVNVNEKYFVGSDNIAYFESDPCGFPTQDNLSPEYNGQCYQVYVDINTPNKGPNTLGRDLFRLFVDGKGSVIPDGGSKAEAYFGAVTRGCNRDGVTDGGYSCAGSIVDNGYRVVYPY